MTIGAAETLCGLMAFAGLMGFVAIVRYVIDAVRRRP
jgi:hypothetical protein